MVLANPLSVMAGGDGYGAFWNELDSWIFDTSKKKMQPRHVSTMHWTKQSYEIHVAVKI
jgi:predicted methyltransferase MtxX (methanogen marker protein 4)